MYPKSNIDIYNSIEKSENSALISEYPPGTIPGKWTFVQRNRIISGLSQATIIVKAPLKSGAMITAKYALDQNREVFACPGNTFDESYMGCNSLITDGAGCVTCSADILNELKPVKNKHKSIQSKKQQNTFTVQTESEKKTDDLQAEFNFNSIEQKIIDSIKKNNTNIDMIIQENDLQTQTVHKSLIQLELKGIVMRIGNNITLQQQV